MNVREIESWFVALGVLESPKGEDINLKESLMNDLKDGTILCRLINRLKPGSIEKVYYDPKNDEECTSNVQAFLKACEELGLLEDKLFNVGDLHSAEQFERVVGTLDCLQNFASELGMGKQFAQHYSIASTDNTEGIQGSDQDKDITSNIPEQNQEMSDMHSNLHLVKATFPFTGHDDDELCFQKGEIIEVTKVVDGGWWEGTLNGKHGWFPSNYVKEISASPEPTSPQPHTPNQSQLASNKRESVRVYHNLVLQNILDTERAHVSELQMLLQNYLRPLRDSNILAPEDMKTLCGNFEELVEFQQSFFDSLEECAQLPLSQQRMGATFLKVAPQTKEFYLAYYANHPRAVDVLTKYSDELSSFMESKGASSPGILTLTTSLSKPFRRLDKYPTLLKELERHLEEGHGDLFDTKKAIAVFQNIATSCHEMRKRKETELEILTGNIEGWEGEELSKLGELTLMTQLLIHGEEGEVKERYFLLFSSVLIVLSVSARLSGYSFEKLYEVPKVTLADLEDTEGILNAFEFHANDDNIKVQANTFADKQSWMDAFNNQCGVKIEKRTSPLQCTEFRQHTNTMDKESKQPSPPRVDKQISIPRADSVSSAVTPRRVVDTVPPTQLPTTDCISHKPWSTSSTSTSTSDTPTVSSLQSPKCKGRWTIARLRPTPPLRPAFALTIKEDSSSGSKSMKGLLHPTRRKQGRSKSEDECNRQSHPSDSRLLEEDMLILSVIEAYCTSARARQTQNSNPIPPEIPPHRPQSVSTLKSETSFKSKKSKKKFNRSSRRSAPTGSTS